MSDDNISEAEVEQLKVTASKAVESGADIHNEVRDITLKALQQGKLDLEHINKVIKAVTEGVSHGSSAQGGNAKEAVSQAVRGLDQALLASVESSKLAVDEAAGRIKDFTQQDVKRAINDVEGLEDIFLETLTGVAQTSSGAAKEIMTDLHSHLQRSGTAVGEKSGEVLSGLHHSLSQIGHESAKSGLQMTQQTGESVARIASGFLAGIADSLQERNKSSK